MFASLLFDSWIGSLKNPPLFLTGVSLITSGHFYLGETGHYYLGLTLTIVTLLCLTLRCYNGPNVKTHLVKHSTCLLSHPSPKAGVSAQWRRAYLFELNRL